MGAHVRGTTRQRVAVHPQRLRGEGPACGQPSIASEIEAHRSEVPDLQHILVLDDGGKDTAAGATLFADAVAGATAKPSTVLEPDDLAGFVYTSGTTGKPKGVRLSHGNLASNVSAIHEIFPVNSSDRSLSFLPWAHSFGQTVELHVLFSLGASLAIAESVDKIVDNLQEVQPTLILSVPRVFNRIYDRIQKQLAGAGYAKRALFNAALANAARRKKLRNEGKVGGFVDFKHRLFDRLVFSKIRARFGGRLRYAISGGAALSRQVADFIDSIGIPVFEGYGLTEASPIVSANYPGTRKIGSIGKAIPRVTVTFDKEATGDAQQGELIVHGPNVMQGYHKLPEETAAVLTADGGLRTGDMGHADAEGFIFITGRIKEQYKLQNGKYVVPSPLEEQLKLSRFIANIMVYGDGRPFNVALIVPDADSLKRWAEERNLPHHPVSALFDNERTHELYCREIDAHSEHFKSFEKVREFKLIGDDFTTDNGLLTPSLKLKRNVATERYRDTLDALYR